MTKPLSYIDENGKQKPLNHLAKLLIIESHLTAMEHDLAVIRKLVHEMAQQTGDDQWP